MRNAARAHPRAASRFCEVTAATPSAAHAADQHHAADDDGADAGPQRDVDGLLFLDVDLDRSDFRLVVFLGVGKTAVGEPQDAADDQRQRHDAYRVHLCLSSIAPFDPQEGAAAPATLPPPGGAANGTACAPRYNTRRPWISRTR